VRLGNENYPMFATTAKLDGLRGEPGFEALLDELRAGWQARCAALAEGR
jgi:hypothetical protein